MELLECKHLCKEFDKTPILKDINLKIPRGKIIGLLGKNGAGKTTLIKLINDLLIPTSGEILINGEKPNVNSKKIISYLPERTYLDKSMKISEVFKFFSDFYENFNIDKAKKLLKDLDLDENKKISALAIKNDSTGKTVFLFDKDGLHPHDLAINTADHITCVFTIYKSRKHRKLGRKIFFHFLTSGVNVRLGYNAFI